MGDCGRQSAYIDIEGQQTVLNVELFEDPDHLLDEERSPGKPLSHVLVVHRVVQPNGYSQPVELFHVLGYDHRRRVPVFVLALDVAANDITSEIDETMPFNVTIVLNNCNFL